MAKVHKFSGGNYVVTEMSVTTPEGTFKGAGFREARYATLVEVAFDETDGRIPEGLRAYAGEVLKAATQFEIAVMDARAKLEAEVGHAARELAQQRAKEAAAAHTAPALPVEATSAEEMAQA